MPITSSGGEQRAWEEYVGDRYAESHTNIITQYNKYIIKLDPPAQLFHTLHYSLTTTKVIRWD